MLGQTKRRANKAKHTGRPSNGRHSFRWRQGTDHTTVPGVELPLLARSPGGKDPQLVHATKPMPWKVKATARRRNKAARKARKVNR